ncbi:hypothetical protein Tco_0964973 [Tanacetum coccineum]
MHIFIGYFIYVVEFMILEDLGSIIDSGLGEVVLGEAFARASKLTYDESLGLISLPRKMTSTWMTFEGTTHDLGSFGEETNEIMDLHQILEEVLLTKHGDDVGGIKQHHRDPSSDGVRDLVMASRRSQLNEDLESST